jgi:hypothetical protein
MRRRRAQRMMPARLRVVRTVFANQLLPLLREKPSACGSSTVNRMHECEMARTSQLFYLNLPRASTKKSDLTNDVIVAISRDYYDPAEDA